MYLKVLSTLLLILSLISTLVICQSTRIDTLTKDTITTSKNSQTAYADNQKQDDEFNIFLLAFGLAAISFMLGFVMLGMAAFLLLVLLIALLIITGIISTSIVFGWMNKSHSSGLKYFLMLTGSVCGITAGALGFGLFCLIFDISLNRSTLLLTGGITGLLAGLFLGYTVFKIILLIIQSLRNKLKWKPNP